MVFMRSALRGGGDAAGGAHADGVQESDEVYLLSGAGDNVKVRDALMDIKVLREVNADGLEQWTPVMKAGFPLPAAEVARVFESLRLPVPALSRASYTLDEFIEAFAQSGGAIRRVNVHKRRVRYTVGGCTAEFSDVVANGKPTRTIAVESTDGARGHPCRAGAWPGRLHQHQLSSRAGGPDRR
jgi:exopolyphosphatase/guanosine-5'-triphosphate,3'-diphosphate pyrophosphatase